MTAGFDNKHVLLIRLSALGDVVHTLPAAELLRERLPKTKLTWIVEAPFVELLKNNPVVDEVLVFPKKAVAADLKNPLSWITPGSSLNKFLKELRSRKFSAAIDFQGLFKSGSIAFLSGAPLRVGFKDAREFAPTMMTHTLDVGDYFAQDKHVVEHNVALAEFLLRVAGGTTNSESVRRNFPLPEPPSDSYDRLQLILGWKLEPEVQSPVVASSLDGASGASATSVQPPVESHSEAEDSKSRKGKTSSVISQPLIVLIPGTTWATKIWSQDKWAALAGRLLELHNVRIVLVGGPSETEMNRYIYDSVWSKKNQVIDLTGKTSLVDLIALFNRSDIVVGADTGPLHMAAATGVPQVVGVFGSTPWKRNGPFGEKTSVVALDLSCQPCFKKVCPLGTLACLNDLEVDRVLDQVKRLLTQKV